MFEQFSNPQNMQDAGLFDYLKILYKRKNIIGLIVMIGTVCVIVYSLIVPKTYLSYAVIMPISGKGMNTTISATGSLGGLAALAGVGGGTPQNLQFLALLKTRTLAERVIENCDLIPLLSNGGKQADISMENLTGDLLSHLDFTNEMKSGVLTITAEFQNPMTAAYVVNCYAQGLQQFINENTFTVAKRYRIFIGEQLYQNKKQLIESGKELNEFYKGNRISSIDSKIDVPLEIELDYKSFKNDNLIVDSEMQSKMETLKKQKEEVDDFLEKINVENVSTDDKQYKNIIRSVPQHVYLQYLTLRRNLLTQINTLLTQNYEMAKMEEAKDELAFQVIDPGRVPETRFKPKRRKMVMTGFIVSLLMGCLMVFSMEYYSEIKKK